MFGLRGYVSCGRGVTPVAAKRGKKTKSEKTKKK
jgi:hypothetical protein